VLIDGDAKLRAQLARQISDQYQVVDIELPAHGLVMMKMRETARRSLFYLGEVLVTESKVQIGETVGLGILAGDDKLAARELAVIDAAFRGRLPGVERWSNLLREEEQRLDASQERYESKLLETRVSFETMEAE